MRIRLLLLALLSLALGACATPSGPAGQPAATTSSATVVSRAAAVGKSPATNPPPPGIIAPTHRQPAPALWVTAFDGSTVTLDDFRGRPTLVSLFESWCPICQAEQPELSKVAKQFAGRVGFVGVSNHDTVAAGRAYARRFAVSYPLANDASGKTWARWKVPYQPVIVLVDKQGRIAERYDGGTTGPQQFAVRELNRDACRPAVHDAASGTLPFENRLQSSKVFAVRSLHRTRHRGGDDGPEP